jgi:DNA-dependent protein kinase catalytic subunit
MTEDRSMLKEQVTCINELIFNPAMDRFTKAVQCLVLPEKLVATHFHQFQETIFAEMSNEKFQEAVKTLHRDVFVNNREVKGDDLHKQLKDWQLTLRQIMSMNWETQKAEIKVKLNSLQDQTAKMTRRDLRQIQIDKLCNWLGNYKWCGDKDFFEIPGQYSGESKPFIEQHVKIVRFENRLKVFSSKQQPLELKIFGSDGKTYNFIIKYGEDLRQDQRIQHVLGLMSRHLSMDKSCKQNHLKIHTYQVVPINSNCGMLSVVQNASTMHDFIKSSFKLGSYEALNCEIKEDFKEFLVGNGSTGQWPEIYENALRTRTRPELIEKLKQMEERVPKDILKQSLMNSALTLETFYILRRNFITSLSAMNVAQWLLGIGDRHLSNILIDIKTGRLIGIDFGVAFGNGANLPVPELVPCRLTSHFVNVLEPMGIDGMIKKNMIHAMRCLRNNSKPILICLEMFVKEPTMDWQQRAKSIGNSKTPDWNPEARIAIVQRKLAGANPLKIISDELSISIHTAKPDVLRRYKRLVEGGGDNLRTKLDEKGLSVDDQVSVLIDMATDKSLLAMIYLGWDPWF